MKTFMEKVRSNRVVRAAAGVGLVSYSAALAQAWTPTFDGVSTTSIQGVLQGVLTSYQNWITAFLVFLGVIVGAAIVISLLQKRSPVKM